MQDTAILVVSSSLKQFHYYKQALERDPNNFGRAERWVPVLSPNTCRGYSDAKLVILDDKRATWKSDSLFNALMPALRRDSWNRGLARYYFDHADELEENGTH